MVTELAPVGPTEFEGVLALAVKTEISETLHNPLVFVTSKRCSSVPSTKILQSVLLKEASRNIPSLVMVNILSFLESSLM